MADRKLPSIQARRPDPEGREDEGLEEVDEVEKPIQKGAAEDPSPAERDATGHEHCGVGAGVALDALWDSRVGQGPRSRRPRTYLDHVFMSRGVVEDERVKPILAMKDKGTQSLTATFVGSKRPTAYAANFVASFLRNLGRRKAQRRRPPWSGSLKNRRMMILLCMAAKTGRRRL